MNIPVLKKNYDQLSFLYSENDYVNLFTVENENTIYKNSKQILRLGFEKNFGFFNSSFYKQLDIPYDILSNILNFQLILKKNKV